MKRWIHALSCFVLCAPGLAEAQRRSETAPDPMDAYRVLAVGLQSWKGWNLETGIEATLKLSASTAQWRQAARESPTAAFYLAAFAINDDWHAEPMSVVEGFSFSCGGRMATPEAVLQRLAGDVMSLDDATQPPLRPGELYHVRLRTSYDDDLPREMQFTTHWFRLPHPQQELGQLRVALEPDPMHWVPVYLSRTEAPVMRIAEVDGWQVPPPW